MLFCLLVGEMDWEGGVPAYFHWVSYSIYTCFTLVSHIPEYVYLVVLYGRFPLGLVVEVSSVGGRTVRLH